MTERRRGFTLVELLVAIALGTILIGVVVFVWMQSTKIFSSTVNNLESYQRLRTVLDLIERDLANTNRTIDMELYLDANANGHFDALTENLLKHVEPGVGPVAAASPGASFRQPMHPNDPLFLANKPEFNEDDDPKNAGFSNTPFFFAPVLFSPPPYAITGDGYLEARRYWRDEVYVRTYASARGTSVPALVHYRLVQGADGRSTIRRRMWFTDESGGVVSPTTAVPSQATDQVSLLASGLCDLKFGFFFKESASSGGSSTEGVWYHVGCPTSGDSGKLLEQDEQRGFRTATAPSGAISTQHADRKQFLKPPTGGGANAVSFVYEGVGRIENTDGFPPLFRTINELDDPAATSVPDLAAYSNFDFPGVRPGDKIYLYDAQDDDDSAVDPDGSGDADARKANYLDPADPTKSILRFPDQVYTVDDIFSQRDPNQAANATPKNFFISMKMREPINFYQLGRRWLLGPSPGVGEPVYTVPDASMGTKAGPSRTIRGSFNVRYRVAFLPPAFLVRLSIDDRYNKQVHQIERVIRILQH